MLNKSPKHYVRLPLAVRSALQRKQERWRSEMFGRIRQSLNLTEILNTTVAIVRQFLQTDRVFILRHHPDAPRTVVVDGKSYTQGEIAAIDDIYTASLEPDWLNLLAQIQVKAALVVPILQGEELWGLLIAHQCSAPRQWQQLEIDSLKQVANQLVIAIQQSELYQQVQLLNTI